MLRENEIWSIELKKKIFSQRLIFFLPLTSHAALE